MESATTPQTVWSGIDVLYAAAGESGPRVTVWTQPADGDDRVARVAEEHALAVRGDGEWEPGSAHEEVDETGSTLVERSFTLVTDVDSPAAAAAYWSAPEGVTVAVARGDDRDELAATLRSFVAASRPSHLLTAEEVLALCEVAGLAPPPVAPTAYPADASDEVRAAAHGTARASLVARGLLVEDGEVLVLEAAVARALLLLLDGDRSLLVSREAADGSSGVSLLGGRGGVVARLGPGPRGSLELSVAGAATTAQRYAAWLVPDAAPPSGSEPFGASPDEVRASVGSTSGPDALRGTRCLASVRGLRRDGEEVSAFDATWLQDSAGSLWAVTPSDDLVTVRLTPVDTDDLTARVRDALDVPPMTDREGGVGP